MYLDFILESFQNQNSLITISIILEMMSYLQIILNIWEDFVRLYANALPFHVRDLNILGF